MITRKILFLSFIFFITVDYLYAQPPIDSFAKLDEMKKSESKSLKTVKELTDEISLIKAEINLSDSMSNIIKQTEEKRLQLSGERDSLLRNTTKKDFTLNDTINTTNEKIEDLNKTIIQKQQELNQLTDKLGDYKKLDYNELKKQLIMMKTINDSLYKKYREKVDRTNFGNIINKQADTTEKLNALLQTMIEDQFNREATQLYNQTNFDSLQLKIILKKRNEIIKTGLIDSNRLISENIYVAYGKIIITANRILSNQVNPTNINQLQIEMDAIINQVSVSQQSEILKYKNLLLNYCKTNNIYQEKLKEHQDDFEFGNLPTPKQKNQTFLTMISSESDLQNYPYLLKQIKLLLEQSKQSKILSNPLKPCQ